MNAAGPKLDWVQQGPSCGGGQEEAAYVIHTMQTLGEGECIPTSSPPCTGQYSHQPAAQLSPPGNQAAAQALEEHRHRLPASWVPSLNLATRCHSAQYNTLFTGSTRDNCSYLLKVLWVIHTHPASPLQGCWRPTWSI